MTGARPVRLGRVRAAPLLAAFALPLVPSAAHADSDGYYCVGDDYVAWETRWEGPDSSHLLHVVRFSRPDGLVRLEPVELPDFQVGAMRCGPEEVEIEGSGLGFRIDLSRERPRPTRQAAHLDPRAFAPDNLGHWAEEGVVDLESDLAPGEFQLVVARATREVDGGLEHYTFTRLVRRAPAVGTLRILDSVALFEGIFLETVD